MFDKQEKILIINELNSLFSNMENDSFSVIISKAINFLDEDEEISYQFCLSTPILNRWKRGLCKSHTQIRKHIIKFLIDKVENI